eukprot:4112076-Amphidinium_carterae.1
MRRICPSVSMKPQVMASGCLLKEAQLFGVHCQSGPPVLLESELLLAAAPCIHGGMAITKPSGSTQMSGYQQTTEPNHD